MKSILLVLLVIIAVSFVAVESRRGSKPRKARVCAKACLNCTDRGICVDCKAGFRLNQETNQCEKDCGKNCIRCDGRRCLECDNGFARITITLRRFRKTVCKPCAKQTSINRKGVDKDDSKCAAANTTEAPCPKKCAACENGICLRCDKGFALFLSAKRDSKFCIPCPRATKAGKFANSDKSQCQEACGKGFKLNPKTKKCEKKKGKKGGNKKPKKQGGKRRPKTPAPLKKS